MVAPRYSLANVTCDEYAECGVIGCGLYGAFSDDFDPRWIKCDNRRALFFAVDYLHAEGGLTIPATNHPVHENWAAVANAEKVAHAVTRAGIWHGNSDPRAELSRCLDGATTPAIIEYFVTRLRRAYQRCDEITSLERRLQQLISEVA